MRSEVGLWCWMMTTQRLLQFHSTWLMASQCSILLNSAPRSAELPLPCKDSAKLGPALHERTTSHDDGQGQGNVIIHGYEDGLGHGRTWTGKILVAWTKLIDGSYYLTIAKNLNVKRIHCLWNSLCLGGFTCDQIECGNGLQLRVRTSPSAPLVQFLNISLRIRKNIIFAFVLLALKCWQDFSYS